jgi:four helix bundle protein
MFDHEKLDGYRIAIDFVAWIYELEKSSPKPSARKHLEEASTSIALNIAEGNGKRSVPDRVRFLEIARGSAFECAACLDILARTSAISTTRQVEGKEMLVRIVSILTKLIARHEGSRFGQE